MSDLKSRLVRAAQAWVAAQTAAGGAEVPLSRLGKRVVGDANFFVRLDSSRSGPTTSTLEKFAAYLTDAGNWPEGEAPAEVCAFAHAVGITGRACSLSPYIPGDSIGPSDAASIPPRPFAPTDGTGRPPAPCANAGAGDAGTSVAPHPAPGLPAPAGGGAADAALRGADHVN